MLHSLSTTSSGRPTYKHLEAMEKVYNKVWKEQDNFPVVYKYMSALFHFPSLQFFSYLYFFLDFWLKLVENFKDQEDDYQDDQLSVTDPLNQVLSGFKVSLFYKYFLCQSFSIFLTTWLPLTDKSGSLSWRFLCEFLSARQTAIWEPLPGALNSQSSSCKHLLEWNEWNSFPPHRNRIISISWS